MSFWQRSTQSQKLFVLILQVKTYRMCVCVGGGGVRTKILIPGQKFKNAFF